MRRLLFLCSILCLLLSTIVTVNAAPLAKSEKIAHYPLTSDAVDITGNNGDMTLTNAPFQDGGVYCNGIYPGGDPTATIVMTPEIVGLNPESCAVSAEFKISEYPPEAYRPVFMCGVNWRWLGVDIHLDGMLGLRYNNSTSIHTDVPVSLDTWHQVMVTYNGTTDSANLYLDGEWVTDAAFVCNHHDDQDISTHNGASGRQFLGIFRNLIVYNGPVDPTPTDEQTWGAVKALYR
ncbi:MAG: LamG-like jellyroll fold domain-containing protein [bacterium]